MAIDPKLNYKVVTTVKNVNGICGAGHAVGDPLEISCHNPAGLCGWIYNDIFPNLEIFLLFSQDE